MANYPGIVKHMTLAIYKGTGLVYPSKERFKQAFNIAMAKCQQYGYIQGGQATAKGRKHDQEGGAGDAKGRLFDEMFEWAMGGPKPPTKKATETPKPDGLPGRPIPTPGQRAVDADAGYNTAHYLGRNKKR